LSEPRRTPVTNLLNDLLGIYWTGYAQHQTHVAMVQSWGTHGLAIPMAARIADEPRTIESLLNRLIDLGGVPEHITATPNIRTTVREDLDNDMAGQQRARPASTPRRSPLPDATTRILVEGILAAEELHLAWLQTEIDRLGQQLYNADRLAAPSTSQP
jgi:bacterioferritin